MRQDYLNLICVRIQLKSSDPNHFPLEYITLGSWDNLRRSLSKCSGFVLQKNSCPLIISEKTWMASYSFQRLLIPVNVKFPPTE